MAFDPTAVIGLRLEADGPELHAAWDSALPAGAGWQVYVDGRLRWSGRARRCVLAGVAPGAVVQVGAVGDGELNADFAADLPAVPGHDTRPTLAWYGGRYQNERLAGFRIHGEPTPGAGVDYGNPLDFVPAYPGGIVTDGWGVGGWGRGGWGRAASRYDWAGPRHGAGTWTFAVVPVDDAGTAGAAATLTLSIAAAPGPPGPPSADYDPATHAVTLTWTAPDA